MNQKTVWRIRIAIILALSATAGHADNARLVVDLNRGDDSSTPSSSGAGQLAVAGDRVIFLAYEPSSGSELWTSDGTAAGTEPGTAAGAGAAAEVPALAAAVSPPVRSSAPAAAAAAIFLDIITGSPWNGLLAQMGFRCLPGS